MAENDGELSFEPNQIITNGKLDFNLNSKSIQILYSLHYLTHSTILERTRLAGRHSERQVWPHTRELCGSPEVKNRSYSHETM